MHSALECGWRRSTTIERLAPGLVKDLGRAEAYPDDPTALAGVEHLQTHLSHLFLTRVRVVKLRKAVDLGFVDFSRRAERTADCEREVALNRRLAPDVYLGVAPLRRASGHFVVREREWWEPGASSPDQVSECVVVMRRLEDGGDALSRLAAGTLRGEDLDAAAALLARFHDDVGLGSPAPWEPEAWWQHVFGPFRDTLATLARAELESPGSDLEALSATAHARFEFLREIFSILGIPR